MGGGAAKAGARAASARGACPAYLEVGGISGRMQREGEPRVTKKPTENEEEYFFRLEMERQREAVGRRREELDREERERLKALHFMRCAKCGMELTEIQFRGVKVDKCFSCGGIYLDDGELEQLAGSTGWFDKLIRAVRG